MPVYVYQPWANGDVGGWLVVCLIIIFEIFSAPNPEPFFPSFQTQFLCSVRIKTCF